MGIQRVQVDMTNDILDRLEQKSFINTKSSA